jgi:hypothetical protein
LPSKGVQAYTGCSEHVTLHLLLNNLARRKP